MIIEVSFQDPQQDASGFRKERFQKSEHIFTGAPADFVAGECGVKSQFLDAAAVGVGEGDVQQADGLFGCAAGGAGDAGR